MQTTTKELERLKARRPQLLKELEKLDQKIAAIENSGFFKRRREWAKRNKEAYELRKSGMKWKDIAAHFNRSTSVVTLWVYRHIWDNPEADAGIVKGWAADRDPVGNVVYAENL